VNPGAQTPCLQTQCIREYPVLVSASPHLVSCRSNALVAVDTTHHTHLACGLLTRGDILVSDIQRGIERLRSKMRLAWFNADGFKTGLCSMPPLDASRSLLALTNNCAISGTFRRLHSSFVKLYTARAHVHHYTDLMPDGADLFGQANDSLCHLISEYERLDACDVPPEDWSSDADSAVLAAIGMSE
jgi:tubulin epsilon